MIYSEEFTTKSLTVVELYVMEIMDSVSHAACEDQLKKEVYL